MTDVAVLAHLGLLVARPGALVAGATLFGGGFAPMPARLGLTALLALLLVPVVQVPTTLTPLALGTVMARELTIGLALALAVQVTLAGAALGGHLTGNQLMLSYGSVIDPQGGVRNNLTASLYANLALVSMFAINAHHAVLDALVASYRALPMGTGGVDGSLVGAAAGLLGTVFILGLRLAAPVIAVMALVEVAAALMARAAPALNLMAITPSVRVAVGLLAMSVVVPQVPGVAAKAFGMATDLAARLAAALR